LLKFNLGKFDRDGYQVIREVIPTDIVTRIHDFLRSHVDRMIETIGVSKDLKSAGAEIANLLRTDASLPQDLRVLMTGHFPTQIRLDEMLRDIPKNANVRALLEAVHRTDRLKMHMPPMARFIMPGNVEAGVPPHQDVSYNEHMDNFITVWVPLVPVDASCGGVTAFVGAPKRKIEVSSKVKNGVWIEGIPTDDLSAENCVPMSPGDVLIFDRYLVHGSMPNISDRVRFSLDYRFFPATSPSAKHYLDMQSWEVCKPETVNA